MTTFSAPSLRCCLLLVLTAPLLGACTGMQTTAASEAEQAPVSAMDSAGSAAQAAGDTAELMGILSGDWRDPKNAARDKYRHPLETLTFFDVASNETVVEITPGATGWYTEILAPYLRENGQYIAAQVDPMAAAEGSSRDRQQKTMTDLKARLAKYPAQLDRAQIVGFDPKQPQFAAPGSVDTVLTFRNVHNWVGGGVADAYFAAFFAALKPGGTLGVVDHRAKPGTDLEKMKKSGYLTEQLVIDLATKAGFVLDARSEVNANPKDTADHPNGVWTLPPTNRHDAEDATMYQAIGESDRMTLRFVKPAR
jgi:predicted methyltransferase